jgi:hypothetical protein
MERQIRTSCSSGQLRLSASLSQAEWQLRRFCSYSVLRPVGSQDDAAMARLALASQVSSATISQTSARYVQSQLDHTGAALFRKYQRRRHGRPLR